MESKPALFVLLTKASNKTLKNFFLKFQVALIEFVAVYSSIYSCIYTTLLIILEGTLSLYKVESWRLFMPQVWYGVVNAFTHSTVWVKKEGPS